LAAGVEPLGEQQVIDYCAEHLARFKLPKAVVFMDLPKTSTGKVQKYALREIAEGLTK
jgi:fatty-acyl-CoA synthase